MPFGTLKARGALPLCSPSYSSGENNATDITMVTITYRVSVSSVCDLIPTMLELEDEPLVTTRFMHYGSSTVGPYSEFVHQVEVTYQGEKFDYNLILILDNEAAVFLGRERFGFPKVLGKIRIQTVNGDKSYLGGAGKTADQPLVNFDFIPHKTVQVTAPPPKKWMLNMRSIPSPFDGAPPSVLELIPATMEMEFSEISLGSGTISFPKSSAIVPWARLNILKHEGAFLVQNARAKLYAREKSRLA